MFNKPFSSQNQRTRNRQKCLVRILFGLLLSLIFSAKLSAQASETVLESISGTSSYNLNYESSASPLPFWTEAAFYVVVSATGSATPTLELEVPCNSWLFVVDSTDLEVGTPVQTGTTYKFPISAERQDGIPQTGTGTYLRVNSGGGIVIAVEDFPTKRGLAPAGQPEESALQWSGKGHFFCPGINVVAQMRLLNLAGNTLRRWVFEPGIPAEGNLPTSIGQGIFILEITYRSGEVEVRKIYH